MARGTVRCVVHVRPAALVRSALEQMRLGVPDEEIALHHGVALNTVRRWRRLHLDLAHPVELRREEVACPRCADALDLLDGAAYAELLGWYLGDGHIAAGRRGVYLLSVINDERYPEMNKRIAEVMARIKPGSRPYTRRRSGAVVTALHWKHWPCLFPQHGAGRKHDRVIRLEPW